MRASQPAKGFFFLQKTLLVTGIAMAPCTMTALYVAAALVVCSVCSSAFDMKHMMIMQEQQQQPELPGDPSYKTEILQIPTRDGVKLNTVVFIPLVDGECAFVCEWV